MPFCLLSKSVARFSYGVWDLRTVVSYFVLSFWSSKPAVPQVSTGSHESAAHVLPRSPMHVHSDGITHPPLNQRALRCGKQQLSLALYLRRPCSRPTIPVVTEQFEMPFSAGCSRALETT